MQTFRAIIAFLALLLAGPLSAQDGVGLTEHGPLEIESYYQIEWGHRAEFIELYKRNHLPILEALQKEGIITSIEIHYPIQHVAGEGAWNMRVRITFRDPNVGMLGSAHARWIEIQKELYPDTETFVKEEAHRLSLLREHWDVAVYRED